MSPLQQFDPPFESPIEEAFAWTCSKYLGPDVDFAKQVECETAWGLFRVDFVLTSSLGIRVAVECDGRDYHDASRDEWRDALLLGSGIIHSMLRFRGVDIHYRADDVVWIVSKHYPQLFDPRGLDILDRLARNDIKHQFETTEHMIWAHYRAPEHLRTEFVDLLAWHRTNLPTPGRRQFWRTLYDFARTHGGRSLDEVMEQFKARGIPRL